MNTVQIHEAIENLKVCIDKGHDFEFVESFSFRGRQSEIQWKCKRCDYTKATSVTEEQEHILMKHKTMKPGRNKNE